MRSLEIRTERIFNNLIKQNQKLAVHFVLNSQRQCPVHRAQRPASRFQSPAPLARHPGSRVQCSQSNFQSSVSRVQSPASRIQRPESRVQSPASRIQCSESSVQSPVSKVQRPESSVQSPGCRFKRPEPRNSGIPHFYKFTERHLFLKKLQTQACNFIKKETLTKLFSCEFCEISESNIPYRIYPVAASAVNKIFLKMRNHFCFWHLIKTFMLTSCLFVRSSFKEEL